jgi:hypothetical protein
LFLIKYGELVVGESALHSPNNQLAQKNWHNISVERGLVFTDGGQACTSRPHFFLEPDLDHGNTPVKVIDAKQAVPLQL